MNLILNICRVLISLCVLSNSYLVGRFNVWSGIIMGLCGTWLLLSAVLIWTNQIKEKKAGIKQDQYAYSVKITREYMFSMSYIILLISINPLAGMVTPMLGAAIIPIFYDLFCNIKNTRHESQEAKERESMTELERTELSIKECEDFLQEIVKHSIAANDRLDELKAKREELIAQAKGKEKEEMSK